MRCGASVRRLREVGARQLRPVRRDGHDGDVARVVQSEGECALRRIAGEQQHGARDVAPIGVLQLRLAGLAQRVGGVHEPQRSRVVFWVGLAQAGEIARTVEWHRRPENLRIDGLIDGLVGPGH